MLSFSNLVFKPEHKTFFNKVLNPMLQNYKNIWIKSELYSGAMVEITKTVTDIGYRLYVYDFVDLDIDRWEDELRNHFGMISQKTEAVILFKNFSSICTEEDIYRFLWSTNTFTDIDASFIILTESNYEEMKQLSTQVSNTDFFYLSKISNNFLDFTITRINKDYDNKINIDVLKNELDTYKTLI